MALLETAVLVSLGNALGGALFSHAFGKAANIGWAEVSVRVQTAMTRGQLPPNGVFERALLRSALLATRHCMDENAVISMAASPTNRADALPRWIGGPFARGAAAVKAYRWLDTQAAWLRHDARSDKQRRETITRLLEGIAPTIGDGRDFAIGQIGGLAGTEAQAAAVLALQVHITDKVIAQGGWQDAAHARQQLGDSCRTDKRWDYAFTHFYAQEIKTDPELRALLHTVQLAVLGSDRHDVLAALDAHFSDLLKRLEQLEGLVTRGTDGWEVRHMFQDPRRRAMSDDRFHFSAEYDAFIGRDDAIKVIEAELFDTDALTTNRFMWMAVCGEGGTGKSRLCQKLVEKAPDWDFANAGFADANFLKDANRVALAARKLEQNTLIVVDYSTNSIADLPRYLGDWVRYAAENANGPAVRLILVLRNSRDPFFKLLENLPASEEGRAIQQAERLPGGRRLTLHDLPDSATSALMQARMARIAAETGKPLVLIEESALLDRLARFDRFKRPLFALMVAEALQNGELAMIARNRSIEEARFALFQTYLKRQRRDYWHPSLSREGMDVAAHHLERHENTVRLATALMGIEIQEYEALRGRVDADTQDLLPELRRIPRPDSLHPQVIHTMTGIDITGADTPPRIAPLEPDLIGECFVLMGRDFATATNAALTLEEVVRLAYQHDPDRTLHFLRMAVQDYPQFMADKSFLLPELG